MGKRTGKNRKTDGRAGYGKRVAAVGMMFVMLFSFAACGKTTASEEAEALSGSCIDILNKVYETADLDESMRDAMQDWHCPKASVLPSAHRFRPTRAAQRTDMPPTSSSEQNTPSQYM